MALKINRQLDNGMVSEYHMITDIQLSKQGNALGIYWAGFKDESIRKDKWKPGNTEATSIYTDHLFIREDDFIENILPVIDKVSYAFCYELLTKRIDYLLNAKKS